MAPSHIFYDMDLEDTEVSYRKSADVVDGLFQSIINLPYIEALIDNGFTWRDRFDNFFVRRAIGMRSHPEGEVYKMWAKILQ